MRHRLSDLTRAAWMICSSMVVLFFAQAAHGGDWVLVPTGASLYASPQQSQA